MPSHLQKKKCCSVILPFARIFIARATVVSCKAKVLELGAQVPAILDGANVVIIVRSTSLSNFPLTQMCFPHARLNG